MSAASLTPEVGATAHLVSFVTDRRPRSTPATRAALRDLIVDTVGVATAGLDTPAVQILRTWVEDQSPARAAGTPGTAPVWGSTTWLGPADAALINGTAAHALDWDDAAPSMAMHPAAVLLPTLFAVAARHEVDGPAFDEAYCVGSAVFRAVSEALPHVVHYGRGWHNTSTTGRLAATAAAAHLLGLDPEATAHALGIAASTAAGSLANFGTMTKPMHAGMTARDAVTAVGLAQAGFTANPAQLEARGGFFDLYGDHDAARTALLPQRLEFWATGWVDDFAIKAYPSCFATQRAIDAGFTLRTQLGGTAASVLAAVESIEVTMEAGGLRPLRETLPSTGLQAKFSLEYTVAVALLTGEVLLSDFTDDALGRPGVDTLMAATSLAERAASPEPTFTEVVVRTTDGRTLSEVVHHSRGDSHNPLPRTDLAAKFAQCVGQARDAGASADWFDRLHAVADAERLDDLNLLLAGPARSR